MASAELYFWMKSAICLLLAGQTGRALENRTIQRVAAAPVEVDFRLVCATHQNIEGDIESEKFRADLFYRINVFPIAVPALASRSVDIPAILTSMLRNGKKDNTNQPVFTDGAHAEMMRYLWPGNVRELRNVLNAPAFYFLDARLNKRMSKIICSG